MSDWNELKENLKVKNNVELSSLLIKIYIYIYIYSWLYISKLHFISIKHIPVDAELSSLLIKRYI